MSGNKAEDADDPFALLLEEIDNPIAPVDLKSKASERSESRQGQRQNLMGSATIYDLQQKMITKAVLRNLSPTGVGFEVHPVMLAAKSEVLVEFHNTGISMGQIHCKIEWTAVMEGHPKYHKMVGLSFLKLPALSQKKLTDFLESLRKKTGYDDSRN